MAVEDYESGIKKNPYFKARIIVSLCLSLCATYSFGANEKRTKPGYIPIGPFDLFPMLDIRQGYDDNIFRNDLNKKPSWVTLIRPGFQFALERALNRYALSYGMQSTIFWDSPPDNFVDHLLRGDTHIELNRRNRFDFNAQLLYSHYQRGTYFSQGNLINAINEPDQFHTYELGGRYSFGAETARGQITLDVNYLDLQFDNHLERTRVRNRQDLTLSPSFFARIFPKTSLLAQFEYVQIDYPDAAGTLVDASGDKMRYLVGATWQQTAKTTGIVKVGYLQMNFDDPRQKSFSDFTWEADIKWRPLSYSSIVLQAVRNVFPTQGFGNSIVVQSYGVDWEHEWGYHFATQAGVNWRDYDNKGSRRKDEMLTTGLELRYRLRSWLNFGLSYSYSDLQSTQSTFDFQRNVVMFSIFTNPSAKRYLQNIY